jgi:hypothetical protein
MLTAVLLFLANLHFLTGPYVDYLIEGGFLPLHVVHAP